MRSEFVIPLSIVLGAIIIAGAIFLTQLKSAVPNRRSHGRGRQSFCLAHQHTNGRNPGVSH